MVQLTSGWAKLTFHMFVLLSLSVVSSTVAHVRTGLGGLLTDESKFAVESTAALTGLTGLFD